MKSILFILSSLFISISALASLENKCGKALADRYIVVSERLTHARVNRMLSPNVGYALSRYLSESTIMIFANTQLQTDPTRCSIIEETVSLIEKSLSEVGNDTIIEKVCNNFTK